MPIARPPPDAPPPAGPDPPNSERSRFCRRRRTSSRSGGPFSGRRCQGFSFLPGSFQAMCVLAGCSGFQAAELAVSRGNSTKPAAGKQGDTRGREVDARFAAECSRAPGAKTRRRGACRHPAGPLPRARVEARRAGRAGAPATAAGRRRGASPPARRSPARRCAAGRLQRRSRPKARPPRVRPCASRISSGVRPDAVDLVVDRAAAGSRRRRCLRRARPPARCAARAPDRRHR